MIFLYIKFIFLSLNLCEIIQDSAENPITDVRYKNKQNFDTKTRRFKDVTITVLLRYCDKEVALLYILLRQVNSMSS